MTMLHRFPANETGQVLVELKCDGCGNVFTAWLWSLSGSGKRCPECGLMHTRTGECVREGKRTPEGKASRAARPTKRQSMEL